MLKHKVLCIWTKAQIRTSLIYITALQYNSQSSWLTNTHILKITQRNLWTMKDYLRKIKNFKRSANKLEMKNMTRGYEELVKNQKEEVDENGNIPMDESDNNTIRMGSRIVKYIQETFVWYTLFEETLRL